MAKTGHLGLQEHGFNVEFKNIKIKVLPKHLVPSAWHPARHQDITLTLTDASRIDHPSTEARI